MPDSSELTLRIVEKERTSWTNRHENFTASIEGLYDIWNPDVSSGSAMRGMRTTISGIQSLLQRAAEEETTLRPLGSGWSISRIADTEGWLVNTKPLNWIFGLSPKSVSPEYPGDPANLTFAQCGASILELNEYLQERGRSLKTSGASNGQTIAGAIATGTHGSALEVGATQDFVAALHLVVSPSRHIWLEPASRPAASRDLTARFGAELIRDDDLFHAALVGLGGCGFVHGVLIETEPLYLLQFFRKRLALDEDMLHVAHTLDFSGVSLPGPDKRPYHFQIVVNPYDIDGGAYIETVYKHPYRDEYTPPGTGPGGLGPGDDLLHVIGTLTDEVPDMVPGLMRGMFDSLYTEIDGREGTLGEQFSGSTIRGAATGAAIGMPLVHAREALEKTLDLNEEEGPFAGVVALRYVKGTEATLGFTRFEPTCVMDLDGVESERSNVFFAEVWQMLDDWGIPYTEHWGKANHVNAETVQQMYGEERVEEWIAAREQLLTDPRMRRVFASPFLERAGLTGGIDDQPSAD